MLRGAGLVVAVTEGASSAEEYSAQTWHLRTDIAERIGCTSQSGCGRSTGTPHRSTAFAFLLSTVGDFYPLGEDLRTLRRCMG